MNTEGKDIAKEKMENGGFRELKEVRFVVPGKPVAKARPRFGNGAIYTPEKTHAYEELVALMYKKEYHDYMFPKDSPLRVVADFYFKPPKSTTKKKYWEMIGGEIRPMKRANGDVDNLMKAVLDSGNGVIWIDDAQVVEVSARKFYGERERVEIYVTELAEGDGW